MTTPTKTPYKEILKDRFFIILVGITIVVAGLSVVLHAMYPYVPPYSGPVTLTGKYIQGFACHVEYTKPDGSKKVYWAGKPGKEVCATIKEGPARMDGIRLLESRD